MFVGKFQQTRLQRIEASERRWLIVLIIMGLGLTTCAVAYTLKVPLLTYYLTPKLFPNQLGRWLPVSATILFGTLISFTLYGVAWWAAGRLQPTPGRLALIGGIAALNCAVLVLAFPLFSDDVFYSIFGGRIVAFYQANPFMRPPGDFAPDPMLAFTGWKGLTMPYGPLWALIGGGLSRLAGSDMLLNLLLFKGLEASLVLVATFLIGLLLYRRCPDRLLPGLVLWAWNPMVMLESAANGHNGMTMMVLILLGLVFVARARPVLAILALTLAALVKYTALLLLPLVIIYFVLLYPSWRARFRALIPAGLVAAGTIVATYWPFWVGRKTIGLFTEGQHYYGTPLAIARDILFRVFPRSAANDALGWLRISSLLLFVVIYLALMVEANRSARQLVRASYIAILVILVVWPFFMPWYTLWAIALAAALGSRGAARQVIVFSMAAALSYLLQFGLRGAERRPTSFWSITSACAVYLPLLTAIFWTWIWPALRRYSVSDLLARINPLVGRDLPQSS